jgi:hypothetical protein
VHLPTPREVYESLDLAEGEWEVLKDAEFERPQTAPDGTLTTRKDNVLTLRRL